jgi:hypothetical protein
MGNAASTAAPGPKHLSQIVNFIATNYILTQNFEDLTKLRDKQYCDKLIILTSQLMNKYLQKKTIDFLAQKTQAGEVINKMTKDQVMFLEKNDLEKLDVSTDLRKKRMCIGLARYYVKVAYIFAAIMMTVNPIYTYKNEFGTTVEVPLSEKGQIPAGVTPKVKKRGLCANRLNALVNNRSMKPAAGESRKIKPKFCDMNINQQKTEETAQITGEKVTRNLGSEPGISELKQLYYDEYDYATGEYTGMSPAMAAVYEADVAAFYKAFTGKKRVPPEVKNFSDIQLRDFHNTPGCSAAPDNLFRREYEDPTGKAKYFVAYAKHIQTMKTNTEKNQDALLEVLDSVFKFAVNPETKKKEITLNPALNDKLLNELVRETQKLIVKLYVQCEEDFVKGLGIFEQIIESQILTVSKSQIQHLEKSVEGALANPGALPAVKLPENLVAPAPEPKELNPLPEPVVAAPAAAVQKDQTDLKQAEAAVAGDLRGLDQAAKAVVAPPEAAVQQGETDLKQAEAAAVQQVQQGEADLKQATERPLIKLPAPAPAPAPAIRL